MNSRLFAASALALLAFAPRVPAAERPVSFTREVVPILTRAGCNAGACHGTPTGKNGFRLSLRGYDPALDIHMLTKEMGGRRIDRITPERSLILQKGAGLVTHEGGRRLDPEGPAFRLVRDWIAQGATDDRDRSPPPVRLEVIPATKVIDTPLSSETLRVAAVFPDGAQVDVTHLTRFAVNDETTAKVSADGTVSRLRAGEVTVTAEYMNRIAPASLLFRDPNPAFRWPGTEERNFIDTHGSAKLRVLQVEPAPLCTDEEFLRRAHLDVTGRLPAPDEVRAFLADKDPDKRAKLIDAQLERPEYADWWGMKWADRLGINQRFTGKTGAVKYYQWVRGIIAANVPEDEFARLVITASGGNYTNPPAGFYRRLRDPQYRGEELAQLFMGVRMQCAKCHNHPGENWTQDDYHGLAAFFARVGYRDGPFFVQIYDKEETVFDKRTGEHAHPRTGAAVRPRFPGGPTPELAPDADRRAAFAAWLTAPDNPYFARNAVNRVWFHLFGRGIVDPPDDFRVTNPPTVPPLLDALAADFVTHRFDRKHLIRTIMNSRVYQSSGKKPETSADDGRYFSRYVPHRLPAEALFDAVCDATGVPEKFRGFPLGMPAARIPDGEFKHPVLETFGRPPRATVCECEREQDASLYLALSLMSGDFVQKKLADSHGRVATLAASSRSEREAVEEMFLATFSRRPTDKELELILAYFAKRASATRQQKYEDVMFALLNSAEFLFQH
jgi:hypothetical protein